MDYSPPERLFMIGSTMKYLGFFWITLAFLLWFVENISKAFFNLNELPITNTEIWLFFGGGFITIVGFALTTVFNQKPGTDDDEEYLYR